VSGYLRMNHIYYLRNRLFLLALGIFKGLLSEITRCKDTTLCCRLVVPRDFNQGENSDFIWII
jgi:hypothetical protein